MTNEEQINSESQLPEFAFVEVMGHAKICGRLSAVKLGVAVMLRVDVLKSDGSGVAYSKMYSPASLFSITPVDSGYCLKWSEAAEKHDVRPVPWLAPDLPRLSGPTEASASSPYDDDNDDDRYVCES